MKKSRAILKHCTNTILHSKREQASEASCTECSKLPEYSETEGQRTHAKKANWYNITAQESGNVLLYVLIAVILFGALSFTLSKQSHNSGTSELDAAKLEFYASQIIGYSIQAKSIIEQMKITGSSIDELNFTRPGGSSFGKPPHTHKIFHPHGGGLDDKKLPKDITVYGEPEDPGWYISSSVNVDWTNSSSTDVILTAYQISKPICETLNKKITGSTKIPALNGQIKDFFINSGGNNDLDTSACADCEGYSTLCISNAHRTSYGFYSILSAR